MEAIDILFGKGSTTHQRHSGVQNRFRYPVYFLKFRTDKEAELHRNLKARSKGCWSFQGKDFLQAKSGAIDATIRAFLQENFEYEAEEIWLQTMPRVFGYAFNPVSFWYCYKGKELDAVLCEVNNTFGERHFYWLQSDSVDFFKSWQVRTKEFHVSPFIPVKGFYKFFFRLEEARTRVDINYFDEKKNLVLSSWVEGDLSPLAEQRFWKLFFQYGWITVFVVIRIHTQALRLWLKGSPFYRKPNLPEQEITR